MVARAKTGSGKTLAYLLPLLQKLFNSSSCDSVSKRKKLAPSAFILVPSGELCQQVKILMIPIFQFICFFLIRGIVSVLYVWL